MRDCIATCCIAKIKLLDTRSSKDVHPLLLLPALNIFSRLPIDEDDIALIFEDIHRGRSIIPPHDVPSRPTLVRWDPNLPLSLENCVVFELNSAEKHVRECWDAGGIPKHGVQPDDVWGEEVALVVARRREEVKRLREWIS